MEATWTSAATADPTWIVLLAALGVVGAAATVVLLVLQREPRTRADRERIARSREPRGAH
ncbi:hypothetical protein D8Y24_04920 [Agrococcus lahaulensis]|nr:hypothetical protein D8Y24_04920 [Agrococcus lahaulensis]